MHSHWIRPGEFNGGTRTMGRKGARTGVFHCTEPGLMSYVRVEHQRPEDVEAHVRGCEQCQRLLLEIANEITTSQFAVTVSLRELRRIVRTYALLASTGVVPEVQVLQTSGGASFYKKVRKNAITRFVMDLGDIWAEFQPAESIASREASAGEGSSGGQPVREARVLMLHEGLAQHNGGAPLARAEAAEPDVFGCGPITRGIPLDLVRHEEGTASKMREEGTPCVSNTGGSAYL